MASEIDPSLSRYITHVHALPQLTREEERALAEEWLRTASPQAAERIVRAHLRYVVSIALKYRRYGLPVSELIAEGNFGLMHALRKFEPARGHRFVTYAAYWIRAYVLNYIIRSWSLVGVGSGALRSKMFFKLRRERVRILNLVGDSAEADRLLAERLQLPTEQVQAMVQRLESRDVSLDTKVYDDSGTTLGDLLVSGERGQDDVMDDDRHSQRVKQAVRAALAGLDHRERFIVEHRLMADDADELSLAEIGRQLGVSRERARQLEARAKRKLRDHIEGQPATAEFALIAA